MAINEQAKAHYEQAVEWANTAETAADGNDWNAAIVYTGLSTARRELAQFCVDNHMLVDGFDEAKVGEPVGGVKPWGGQAP
jgi:hypothetical protein